MSQPFYQPARQNFSSSQSMQQPQGGFGGFGGGQMPQQNWGGGQGFSGFGGGQGFNFGGGQAFGGFQQQQFNPFQGGFGGGFGSGFSPFQGGFGGFNPMFGGIGGLGFNPMMGPQFGMPMQQFGFGGFNPYQQRPYNPDRANESGMPMPGPTGRETFDNPRMMDMMYRGGPQMSPEMRQSREQDMRNMERIAQNPSSSQNFGAPLYSGIGGLGFNPMMGPQFGMPMQGFNPYQQHVQFQPQMTAESAADINRAREQRENMQMQNIRSNWSQAGQGATSGMDFLQRLQGLSGGSYVPLSDEQMRLERDARLYSMTPQQRAMAQG